ncbi:MAG TPA: type II toxin-antitoxin system VapC family toxin [Spirochaetota bacterium]|nr:type II toxin-antitoxin system VapC family toxin [Spirochaetota bacterium]HPI88205.1 type II toxin-antitoxin system VapC family toxin [Spirochaetota bacterium]HPR47251.1 type II toxin-antitoxin system VapC family toxin [Spirochaetota bacterium]
MASGKYLLDTNIIIALFNNDREVIKKLTTAKEIFICNTVIGELYYGIHNSLRKNENKKRLEEFIACSSILENNIETAKIYGSLKSELKKKGKPIPENDIWVAALAIQYGLQLITRDKHFKEIKGLSLVMLK